ncbi:hypothetical protein [Mucilaginibacter flavus]|uniref:hypothetical protein n=1 Tax=Mucilaginibacter flavus TaxID=931504 RepID=UPI0025B61699|nr:hypothetical protein [Mucilaginibacter flavus]MDN3580576.1 hypothetical protein [Mucilaginibacter flavus]
MKELTHQNNKTHTPYRISILGGLESIILQKTYHIDPHKTGFSYSYTNKHINKKSQDSINMSLRVLLEKIKKAGLLTDKVYTYALKSIDSGRYLVELQMIGSLTEMSSRMEWLTPKRLLPVAEELHKNSIVNDSSFLRLKDDINQGKIESAFQLNDYCNFDRVFDMAKYPDDPAIWLEQMHRDIASILPDLEFTDFSYTEIPDTSISLNGVRFKVSLTCNGHVYKHISLPINNYRNPRGKVIPKDIFVEDFYRIFNKVLTDSKSPYRLHSMMLSHTGPKEDINCFALIALKNVQGEIFMKEPCMSYMLVSMDGYDNALTSAKIDSTIAGWKKMGVFKHLSNARLKEAIDETEAADPFSTATLLSNFPGVIYNLHDAESVQSLPYADLLTHFAQITHGEFNPSKIIQIKASRGFKLQYLSKGKIHSYTFPTAYGWFDVKFPTFLKQLSRENNLTGNFYHLRYDEAAIYLTKQQYDYALTNKLFEFNLDTKAK